MSEAIEQQRVKNVGGITGKGFKPGQSGNPGGRPKGTTLTGRLRVALEQPAADGRPKSEVIAEKLVELALDGDRQAIKDIFERVDGKVPDRIAGLQGESLFNPAALATLSPDELRSFRSIVAKLAQQPIGSAEGD